MINFNQKIDQVNLQDSIIIVPVNYYTNTARSLRTAIKGNFLTSKVHKEYKNTNAKSIPPLPVNP